MTTTLPVRARQPLWCPWECVLSQPPRDNQAGPTDTARSMHPLTALLPASTGDKGTSSEYMRTAGRGKLEASWRGAESGALAGDWKLLVSNWSQNKVTQWNTFKLFPFLRFSFFSPTRAVCLDWKQPAEVDNTPRESHISSLFFSHCTPLYSIWAHATAPHFFNRSPQHKKMFRRCCEHKSEHVPRASRLIYIAQTHHILQYLDTLMTIIPHHTTPPVFCDADYILMLNSVMEYNHDSLQPTPRGVGADIGAAISSLIICLFTFLFWTGECHFILRFQSGFRLCEYSMDCSPPPVCLP